MFKNIHRLPALALAALLALVVVAPVSAQTCSAETAALFETMEAVAALDVPIENALLVELATAMASLAGGDLDAVIADIEAFIKKVETQSGKKLDAAAADELIALALKVLAGAQCPCTDFWNDLSALVRDGGQFQALSIPQPTPIIGFFSQVFGGGFGVQFDFFGTGAATGFVCGGDDPFNPPLFLVPMNTQEELDGCLAVMEGFYDDFNCPAEGGPCGASLNATGADEMPETSFITGK